MDIYSLKLDLPFLPVGLRSFSDVATRRNDVSLFGRHSVSPLSPMSARDPEHIPGGEIVLGGTDPSYYTGSFNYMSTTETGKWEIGVRGYARQPPRAKQFGNKSRISDT